MHAHPRFRMVAIACSAGGVRGLPTVLRKLGPGLPVPVLVAQHLSRHSRTVLDRVLARASGLPVKLAEHGEHPCPGMVYLAPPNRHLCVDPDGSLRLTREPPVNYVRPAADPLFESLSEVYGAQVLVCVLTGMDADGSAGAKAVSERGGMVIVQDPETAEWDGMPRAALRTGVADLVLHLEDIGEAIRDRVLVG